MAHESFDGALVVKTLGREAAETERFRAPTYALRDANIAVNKARGMFDPLIEFYRPIPPLAYLSLIIIWFGIGELAKIILIYLAVFAPVAIATAGFILLQ